MRDKQLDFLAVGDTVIDAFIELEEATVHCNIDNSNCTISMRWGDKIPYKDVEVIYAVGNSPNAATSAARLGLSSGLMSHVGQDENGEKCLATIREQGISTDFMTTEASKKTNYHYVLRYGAERTILIKHEEFGYNLAKQTEGKTTPTWIYLSSVAKNSLPYHAEIATWIQENNIKLAFQPGTFQIKLGTEVLKDLYANTEIFFCNKEEAERILKTPKASIEDLLKGIYALGPKIVCVTDGINGAYATDGTSGWFIPIYPDPKPPISRTGAGDAFSSTFTSAIALGKNIEEALTWGPINSMSVVQQIGAQKGLLTRAELEEYLAKAPESYKVEKIF